MASIDGGALVAIITVAVTVLLAVIAMAVAWGTLRERVRTNSDLLKHNRDDHRLIFEELRELNRNLKNGKSGS